MPYNRDIMPAMRDYSAEQKLSFSRKRRGKNAHEQDLDNTIIYSIIGAGHRIYFAGAFA